MLGQRLESRGDVTLTLTLTLNLTLMGSTGYVTQEDNVLKVKSRTRQDNGLMRDGSLKKPYTTREWFNERW